MKKVFLLLLVGVLVWLLVASGNEMTLPKRFSRGVQVARNFYAEHPLATILTFCCAHIIAATFSLPGSCSLLNVAAGSVFGFWRGCAIVYPVTMVSAMLGYVCGKVFRSLPALSKLALQLETIKRHAADHDYIYFVSLRLSPFLPFGMLNLAMGFLRIPVGLYLLSTFVGIFFDVVLLNNVGAAAVARSHMIILSFVVLFFGFLWIRAMLRHRLGESF